MGFDMPLSELQKYRPVRDEPADFNAFWQSTLQEARGFDIGLEMIPFDSGLSTIETFDVLYRGFAGEPISGWLLLPRVRSKPLACVVECIGYGSGRGFPTDWLVWASVGCAHFVIDTRGQGALGRPGRTPDSTGLTMPSRPGFLTRGIENPASHYYRRLITDTVRAVDSVGQIAGIDQARIALTGSGQGGGVAIATAGLHQGVAVVMPDLPFLCDFRRLAAITDAWPFSEVLDYCKVQRDNTDMVFSTLRYFDAVNFAPKAKAEAFFSVALCDRVCPPSAVFAAFNHYGGPKSIQVWPFNGHEGGEGRQVVEKVKFLRRMWY